VWFTVFELVWRKKHDAVQLDACRNDSLDKVILDIHRTGNFIRAKLRYRQLSAPDLSAPDKLFRLRGRQHAAANPSVSSTTNSRAFLVSVLNHRNRRTSKIVSLVNHRNLTAKKFDGLFIDITRLLRVDATYVINIEINVCLIANQRDRLYLELCTFKKWTSLYRFSMLIKKKKRRNKV